MVKQDVFEPMPSHPTAHASALTELPNGNLLCAFYAGAYETTPNQAIFIAQAHMTLQGAGLSSSLLFVVKSLDGGETWGEPQLLSAVRGTMPRTKPSCCVIVRGCRPFTTKFVGDRSPGGQKTTDKHGGSSPFKRGVNQSNPPLWNFRTGDCWHTVATLLGGSSKQFRKMAVTIGVNLNRQICRTQTVPLTLGVPDSGLVLAFNDSVDKRKLLSTTYSPDEKEE